MNRSILPFFLLIISLSSDSLRAQGKDTLKHFIIGIQYSNTEYVPSLTTYTDGEPYITPKNIDRSFSTGILLGMKFKNDYTLKLRFAYTRKRLTGNGDTRENTMVSTNTYDIDYFTFNSKIFSIIPEISWEWNRKRIGFSYGFVTQFKHYDSIELFHSKERVDNNTSQPVLSENTNTTIPGGYALGAGGLGGLHYNINKRLRIGVDYYSTFNYYSLGGQASSTYSATGSTPLNISGTFIDKSQKTELNSKLNFFISLTL